MWSPTHIQVLVKKAKGLNVKGKHGTNDAFVTIQMGKEKFQTSVKEKATENVEWCEQCELTIPREGNRAEVVLTALHRNFLGVDEFLGMVTIPLNEFEGNEKKTKWYPLQCKPGQKKSDYRGELEVRIAFTVKSVGNQGKKDKAGSVMDVSSSSKKDKSKGSTTSLSKKGIGSSLMSLGSKEKSRLQKMADKVGHKVDKMKEKTLSKTNLNESGSKKDKKKSSVKYNEGTLPDKFDLESSFGSFKRVGSGKNQDPGVHSDDEDDMFKFDALSHRSSNSSLHPPMGVVSKTSTPLSGSMEHVGGGVASNNDLFRKSFGTPLNSRRSNTDMSSPTIGTPKSSRSFHLDTGETTKEEDEEEEVLDEWEAKLLGKKGAVPYKGSEFDTSSTFSGGSGNSFSIGRSNSGRQRNNMLTPPQETPTGQRKKIIPVGSDFEMTPSPESPKGYNNSATLPANSSLAQNNVTSSPTRHDALPRSASMKHQLGKKSASTFNVSNAQSLENSRTSANRAFSGSTEVLQEQKRKQSIGSKLKGSYSFKEKEASNDSLSHQGQGQFQGQGQVYNQGHNRTLSNDSMGQRMDPYGRETTPTPNNFTNQNNYNNYNNQPNRIPRELMDRYEGKTREDLIEQVISLQSKLELQAKKQTDLEDYIDSLLSKVINAAPDLLQKNNAMEARFRRIK